MFSRTSAYLCVTPVLVKLGDKAMGLRRAYPRGSCLYSIFLRTPAVQTRPSSLHLLQGNSPSHWFQVSKRNHFLEPCCKTEVRTFVFFIRHLSQAFQTRLCLPSMPCVTCSWWCREAALDPARLDVRWLALIAFVLEPLAFLDSVEGDVEVDDLLSSAGGEGRLWATIVNVCM